MQDMIDHQFALLFKITHLQINFYTALVVQNLFTHHILL